MNKQSLAIIIISFVTLLYMLIFMPYLSQKTANNVANEILQLWQNGNQEEVFERWIKPDLAPPLYGINSYNIENKRFYKENKRNLADYDVTFSFGNDNYLKDVTHWTFTLERTHHGWQAKNLVPAE